MTKKPTPSMARAIANAERAISNVFRVRDRMMDAANASGDWTAVERQERLAARWQLDLATMVEPTDPERAKRLRDMAEGHA